ncbi:conserved exported protein of unknown function [Candidatus Promineifilum breve]|uniref:Uncharacterized protein n=1 Tax=Candidatus Promineifilum breve TaxID=1806508 RepID=A0A170PK40_9CHLR|nr:hypothetical protein [Candidatus Promineifilum breve]CUS06343.1 conserved exported protein of unknown function [Candidatus Promineifilum breve]
MNRVSTSIPWRRRAFLALLVMALLLIPSAALAQSAPPSSDGLEPGEHVTYEQEVPINVVFVGYEEGDLALGDMEAVLPAAYAPIVRYPAFYGLAGRDMGLNFTFDYSTYFADAAFEDDFFGYLADTGTPGPMTLFQSDYNAQVNNVLDVTDPVLYIDGPSAEWWLMDNAGRLGVDPAQGYTIFFINWYSRPDFQFHVYTKTDAPDPDTGYNFGEVRDSRKMIAWGGSHGRTWFYDLSAGPEAWTDNWNVDDPDLDGDGVEDYRMPPIWEYAAGGFRDPAALSEDLGLVARFVAINLLFTPSPLYDPLVSSPGPEGDKILHVEMFELDGNGRVQGTHYYNAPLAGELMSDFQPYYDWQSAVDLNPRAIAGVQRTLRIFSGRALLQGCWQNFGTPFAQMFCFFDRNYGRFVPAYGPQDYVAAQFAFHTTATRMGDQFGLLGFADDDWVTGTPSYVFTFGAREYRELGYGFTSTVVHEGGHHIGLSHPHDGYDAEMGLDYGPGGSLYFAWSGDEADSVMNYLGTTNLFGMFNQDSMNRYIFAGYLNWANMILADIVAHPDAASVQAYVDAAEAAAMLAQDAFWAWDYDAAAAHARTAYEQIGLAAMQLGISTDMVAPMRAITPTGAPPKEGDPIRFPNN